MKSILILAVLLASVLLVSAGTLPGISGPFLLHDLREYDSNVGMHCMSTTDAVPPIPPPTTLLAMQFTVPASVFSCNNLTIDVGLSRRVGGLSHSADFATGWLWTGADALATGNLTTSSAKLAWSGNLTLPPALTEHRQAGLYWETVRFSNVMVPRNLAAGTVYWFGLTVGMARAYHAPTATYNEVRWLPVQLSNRVNTFPLYRAIDPYGNGVAVQHKAFVSWTQGDLASAWIVKQLVPNGLSSTYRLSGMIVGTCSSRLNASDPRHLLQVPAPYDPLVPVPVPVPVPSPIVDVVGSPSPLPVAVAPSPIPSSSSSSSPTVVPIPTPLIAHEPSPAVHIPSPRVLHVPSPSSDTSPSDPVPLPNVSSPTAKNNINDNDITSARWIPVLIATIVIGFVLFVIICVGLGIWAWCYTKGLNGYRLPLSTGSTISQEEAFNDVYQTGYKDFDANAIELDSRSDDAATAADAAEDTEEVFQSAEADMMSVPLSASNQPM